MAIYSSTMYVQEVGTLEVSGYVRGRPLSVNGLLHIPGLGDFQMTQVSSNSPATERVLPPSKVVRVSPRNSHERL